MNPEQKTSLRKSILLLLAAYGTTQIAGVSLLAYLYGFNRELTAGFYISEILFHSMIAIFMLLAHDLFYRVSDGEKLVKVNAANKVTLFRISMLPTVLFLILAARDHLIAPVLIPVIAITFLTDLLDGWISRTHNQVTQIGKVLDSVSDYALLIVVAIAYRIFNLLPLWLFLLIIGRLAFQAIGMLAILIVRKKVEPRPSILGKIAVATTMSLFALEALKLVLPPIWKALFVYVEIIAGAIVGLSVIDKGLFFRNEVKSIQADKDLAHYP
jgi:phosphatidylglycerophosphate synthase